MQEKLIQLVEHADRNQLLTLAASRRLTDLIAILLKECPNPLVFIDKLELLGTSVWCRHLETCKFLMNLGTDLNKQKKPTILLAATKGNDKIVRFLLQKETT
jgi:hypothetical protein